MATAHILFYPVGNGDMTLIETASGRKILIDTNIRTAADDPDDETPDVAAKLRARLTRDSEGRLYVDVLLLSHPDEDHSRGMEKHFHLGPLATYSKKADKIVVREMWSSPIVFRRASKTHTLCDDAKAFQREAIRRVQHFRDQGTADDGDRILILGEDENGKTDDLTEILITIDSVFTRVNGAYDTTTSMRLLGPLPVGDEEEEDRLAKNHSSTIIQFTIADYANADACRFLTAGDAEVLIWERLWKKHEQNADVLAYDILQSPHHCSWHSLSYDSWSQLGEKAKLSPDARKALGQARSGANIIASSKPITDADADPPCVRAKREYKSITDSVKGEFRCVGDSTDVLEFEITKHGPRLRSTRSNIEVIGGGGGAVGQQPLRHG